MASNLIARLKKIEKAIPPPKCKHPRGLLGPSESELEGIRQEIQVCPACKGRAIMKVFTRENAGEFKQALAGMISDFTPDQWKAYIVRLVAVGVKA